VTSIIKAPLRKSELQDRFIA